MKAHEEKVERLFKEFEEELKRGLKVEIDGEHDKIIANLRQLMAAPLMTINHIHELKSTKGLGLEFFRFFTDQFTKYIINESIEIMGLACEYHDDKSILQKVLDWSKSSVPLDRPFEEPRLGDTVGNFEKQIREERRKAATEISLDPS